MQLTPRIRKAVFPVAGLGTRFLPVTKSVPKELLPIVDKPLIQYAVEEAIEAGVDTLIFVTSQQKQAISNHFDSHSDLEDRLREMGKDEWLGQVVDIIPRNVSRVEVIQEKALGLGHAILCAESAVAGEPFAILLADDLVWSRHKGALAQMVDVYEKTGASVVGVEEIPIEMSRKYGLVGVSERQDGWKNIIQMVEKPEPANAPSNLGIVGRYILSPQIFSYLRNTQTGVGGEIQLTDGIAAMLEADPVLAYPFEGIRYDCGSRHGFIKATIDYALQREDMREDMLAHLKAVVNRRGED
jgi:UTP--glucose-1-phosphate uridylyltransferase